MVNIRIVWSLPLQMIDHVSKDRQTFDSDVEIQLRILLLQLLIVKITNKNEK